MKYLVIIPIVLMVGCSKAPDVLDRILNMASEKKQKEKVLTPNEKGLVEQSDEKEWADVNK